MVQQNNHTRISDIELFTVWLHLLFQTFGSIVVPAAVVVVADAFVVGAVYVVAAVVVVAGIVVVVVVVPVVVAARGKKSKSVIGATSLFGFVHSAPKRGQLSQK